MKTPEQTANLIARGIKLRSEKKSIHRFMISTKGIAVVAGRERIDVQFMTQVSSELFSIGWCMFKVSHTNYCFIDVGKAENWRKISGKNLLDEILEDTNN